MFSHCSHTWTVLTVNNINTKVAIESRIALWYEPVCVQSMMWMQQFFLTNNTNTETIIVFFKNFKVKDQNYVWLWYSFPSFTYFSTARLPPSSLFLLSSFSLAPIFSPLLFQTFLSVLALSFSFSLTSLFALLLFLMFVCTLSFSPTLVLIANHPLYWVLLCDLMSVFIRWP